MKMDNYENVALDRGEFVHLPSSVRPRIEWFGRYNRQAQQQQCWALQILNQIYFLF